MVVYRSEIMFIRVRVAWDAFHVAHRVTEVSSTVAEKNTVQYAMKLFCQTLPMSQAPKYNTDLTDLCNISGVDTKLHQT